MGGIQGSESVDEEAMWFEEDPPWVVYHAVPSSPLMRLRGAATVAADCMHCSHVRYFTFPAEEPEAAWPDVVRFLEEHRHVGREALAYWDRPGNVEGYERWRAETSQWN